VTRAIDFHVHPPIPEWLDASMAGYIEPAEAYFRSTVVRGTFEELAGLYRGLDVTAVLLGWDAETATGRPALPNAVVARACAAYPDVFVGFGSVDPHKGAAAVDALDAVKGLGLRGLKLHPSLQAFAPDDERFFALYERCQALGLPVIFHTGTSGIGARQPGGQGIRLAYSRPIHLDAVAATFPALTIIAAHFGWPWHDELLAIALHKTNVLIDISGWAPSRIPGAVVHEMSGRLQDQFLFGSDYPFIDPERCLRELASLGLSDEVAGKVLLENARRLLGR
jgi:predicted TIM-barrel fold metal-dependent hydrolase